MNNYLSLPLIVCKVTGISLFLSNATVKLAGQTGE